MSRAFTKERDDLPEPALDVHPAGGPVLLTPAGRQLLEDRLAQAQSPAERRRLERLLDDVVIVDPPADTSAVAFGAIVDVSAGALGERRFQIVGVDEADARSGRFSVESPLGIALLGARVGDAVLWHRPIGDLELRIAAITYADRGPRSDRTESLPFVDAHTASRGEKTTAMGR